jgi:hypothetical protein
MRDDEARLDLLTHSARGVGDLSFAALGLTHAECGEDGAIELRLGARLLIGWCPSCATLEAFGSSDCFPDR